LVNGKAITYGDVVKEYVRLNQAAEPFARIPQVRYINFMSDFLQHEKGATHAGAIAAWKHVKAMDAPNTYRAWAAARTTSSPSARKRARTR
jgi:hypothetical protein